MVEVRLLHIIILLLIHFIFLDVFLITVLFVFLILHLIAIAALHGLLIDANPFISPDQEEKFIFTLLINVLGVVGVLITILLFFCIVLLLITISALCGLLIVAHEDTTGDYSWSSEC